MSVNVIRNLGDLDRDICQPLGRILQDAFSYDGGLVSEGAISCGTFAAPIAMTATKTQVLMASSNAAVDPGGAITVRNFWSRAKISAAQTAGGSAYGSVNQLRVASPTVNYAISSLGVYAGAWDVFEASDTDFDVTFTNLKAIGCHAKIEIAANHTITSGKFHGINIGNAVLADPASADEFVGLFIETDGGAYDWKHGINVNNSTIGIELESTCTTGIRLNQAACAINSDGYVKLHHHQHINEAGDLTGGAYTLQVQGEDLSTSGTVYGIYNMSQLQPDGNTGTATLFSIYSQAWLPTGYTMTAGYITALKADLTIRGTLDGGGVIGAAIIALMDSGGTFTNCSSESCLWLDSHADQVMSGGARHMLNITNNAAGTVDNCIYVHGNDLMTNFIGFSSGCGNGMVTATGAGGGTRSHSIRCKVAGTDYWLSLYTD